MASGWLTALASAVYDSVRPSFSATSRAAGRWFRSVEVPLLPAAFARSVSALDTVIASDNHEAVISYERPRRATTWGLDTTGAAVSLRQADTTVRLLPAVVRDGPNHCPGLSRLSTVARTVMRVRVYTGCQK